MKRTKVAFITSVVAGNKYRGIGVYSENLFKAIKESGKIDIEWSCYNANFDRYDLVHFPYFDPFFLTLPLVKKKPSVVTVHDLIPLKYPDYFPVGIRGKIKWQIQRFSLKKARMILTDSQFAKGDIIRFGGIDQKKIKVIHLGVGKEFRKIGDKKRLLETKKKLNLPNEFLLYVGDINYNKNIKGLISVYSEFSKRQEKLDLVLVGKGFVTASSPLSEIKKQIYYLGLEEKVHRVGYVKQDDLVNIYNLAKVYLQLSLAEGFGLPVLEAMACGTPVIASNRSSLPEIVGNSAVLVDPLDREKIIGAIGKVLHFGAINYQNEVEERIAWAKKFTWEKCAGETIEVYKKVVDLT